MKSLWSQRNLLTINMLGFCLFLSCSGNPEPDNSPPACDQNQVELISRRVAWSSTDNVPLKLSIPECMVGKTYALTLTQDTNTVTLYTEAISSTEQKFIWTGNLLQKFKPGVVTATISLEQKPIQTRFVSIYNPSPFAVTSSATYPIGQVETSYPNYGVLSLGLASGKLINPSSNLFTLFAISKLSSDSVQMPGVRQTPYKYFIETNKIKPGYRQAGSTYDTLVTPALGVITNSVQQDPIFFYAVPQDEKLDAKKSYIIYQLPDNAATISSYPFFPTHISSLAKHPMMAIDHQGHMLAIGDEQGHLEVYRFVNHMVFPIQITKSVPNAAFLAVGSFVSADNPEKLDVLVLDQNGDLFVLPYEQQTQSLGAPLLLAHTAEQFPLSPISAIAIGDVDQDGLADIALTSQQTIRFLLNQGPSSNSLAGWSVNWASSTLSTNIQASAVLIGDLNQDGLNDLVVANTSTSTDPKSPNTMLQIINLCFNKCLSN